MEAELDEIEEGKSTAYGQRELIFAYVRFEKDLKHAALRMATRTSSAWERPTDFVCEKCGKPMVIKCGKLRKLYRLHGVSGLHEYSGGSR